tara:strand:+ start:383 stop:763 length:381 start_codon:yes stop_codon:yes gene_type:complete
MNITVRRLTVADVYRLRCIVSKEIAEAAYISWPFTKEVALSFITEYNTWAIMINDDIFAGAIEIKDTHETAYLVASRYQNNGIATAAIKQIKEIFRDRQLWCMINPENVASLRVATKSNMRIQFYR